MQSLKDSNQFNRGRQQFPCHFYFHTRGGCRQDTCRLSHEETFRATFTQERCNLCNSKKTGSPATRSNSRRQKPTNRINRTPKVPCHFFHLKLPHDEAKCTFLHSGEPLGKCPVTKCPRCVPCHFFHLNLRHNQQACKFKHEGHPAGQCIRKNCPFCKIKLRPPCHFYHLKLKCPHKKKCKFSHFGEPAGECLLDNCPICEEAAAKQALKNHKKTLKRLTLELPKWAVRRFYAIYQKEIARLFEGTTLTTTSNLVILAYPKDREEVVDYWNTITEKYLDYLEKISWTYQIPGTSIFAVIRNGLEVTDILFPGEYYRLDFTFPPDTTYADVCRILEIDDEEDVEEIRLTPSSDSVKVNVKFISKAHAVEFYNEFTANPKENVDCQPVCPVLNKTYLQCSVIMRFSVRGSSGTGRVTYSNPDAAEVFQNRLRDHDNMLDGSKVNTQVIDNSVMLSGLNPFTNEYTISRIGEVFDEMPAVTLSRAERPLQMPRNFLSNKIAPELATYTNQIMAHLMTAPKQSKRYPNVYKYEIFFKTKSDAEAFLTNCDGKAMFGYPCSAAKLRFRLNISIPAMLYKIFMDALSVIPYQILSLHDPKIKFKLDPFNEEYKYNDNKVTIYRKFHPGIESIDPLEMEKELATIENYVRDSITGDKIHFTQYDKNLALSPSMLDYYRELAREPMYKERLSSSANILSQSVWIYSDNQDFRKDACERASARIRRLKELENEEKIELNNYRIANFKYKLKKKLPDQHLELAHFDVAKKRLTILTKDNKMRQVIMKTLENCSKANKKEVEQELCAICMADEASYKGSGCAHKFCIPCLEASHSTAAQGTSVFIKCPEEGCGVKICPYDLIETARPEDLRKLVHRHVNSYLAAHKNNFVYCVDGCPNLFKIPAKGSETETITCEVCLKKFCGRSLSELHAPHSGNMPCPIDSKLKAMLLKDEKNKMLKCCGNIVEKLEGGCNKVKCTCGKFVCWQCLDYFDDMDQCYSHLIDKHGGYHEANEINSIMEQTGAKKLECCGNLVEKTGGCNHMTCSFCSKHSCWVCLAFFNTDSECYHHMRQIHGGIF